MGWNQHAAWRRPQRWRHRRQAANNRASHGVHRLAAVELVPAALNSAHSLFGPASAEVWHRWHAARGHQPGGEAVEQARQILAMLTLIQELWTFQQAGVEPAALYADRDNPGRLRALLDRDTNDGDASPAASLAALAIFGTDQALLDKQTALVDQLDDEQLRAQLVMGARTLTMLHGPWALSMLLADPVGRPYVWPHGNAPQVFRRCGADIATATAIIDMVIAEEIQRIAEDFPAEELATEVSRLPADRVATMHHEVDTFTRFLAAALAAHYATGEPWDVRVDDRPVPPALVSWVLDLHRDADSSGGYPASSITVGGLRIRFALDADQQTTVAQLDAAGTVERVAPDGLLGLLRMLSAPEAVTTAAKLRLTGERLGRHLTQPALSQPD